MKIIRCIPLALASVALVGCVAGAGDEPTEQVGSTAEALSSNLALPEGMTCGLWNNNGMSWYTASTDPWFCDGQNYASSGYDYVFPGDFGEPAHDGFLNDSLFVTTPPGQSLSPDWFPLPRGVTCGLKHSHNDPGERCLGYDAAVYCPYGWQRRTALDEGSSEHWSWCEYQDVHSLCANGTCRTKVPLGTTCGLSHNGPSGAWGICENLMAGPGEARTSCPSGWTLVDPKDVGAPYGVGLQWCYRSS